MKKRIIHSKFKVGDKVTLLGFLPIYAEKLHGVLTIKKIIYSINKNVFLLEFEGVDLTCGVNEGLFKKSNRKGKIDRFFSE